VWTVAWIGRGMKKRRGVRGNSLELWHYPA
jgi:hypothetical protein